MPWADPRDSAGLQLWLPTAYTAGLWVENSSSAAITHVLADGALVGRIDDPSVSAHRVFAQGTTVRPTFRTGSGRNAALQFDGSTSHVEVENSKAAFRFIHVDLTFTICVWAKKNLDGTSQFLCDSSQSTTANAGFSLSLTAANKVNFFIAKASAGNAVINKTTTAGLAVADGWTPITITCNAGSGSIQVGANAAESFTCAAGASAGTNSQNDLEFGAISGTHASKFNGWIADFSVWNTVLSSGDLASYRSFDPAVAATTLGRQVTGGTSIAADGLSHLRDWLDYSDTASLYTDTGKTTNVASDGDAIAVAANKTGAQYLRDFTQSSSGLRPLYKTNINNGLGCGLWDGSDDTLTMTSAWGKGGAFTLFVIAKNLDQTIGSHILFAAGNSYLVVTGFNYSGNTGNNGLNPNGSPYVGLHCADSNFIPVGNLVNPTGFNIIEIVCNGSNFKVFVNGIHLGGTGVGTNTAGFSPVEMGGDSARAQWRMDGYIQEYAHYTVDHSIQSRDAYRRGLASKYSIPNVFYSTNSPVQGARWIRTFRRRGGRW